jgi:hypothetical protein
MAYEAVGEDPSVLASRSCGPSVRATAPAIARRAAAANEDAGRLDRAHGSAAVREEVFRLNLTYLMLAKRLIAEDPVASVVFSVRESLLSWLRSASIGAITTLARSPVALFTLRLPRQGAERVLAACCQSDGLGAAHLTMTAVTDAGESAR